jgi:hypothetical protein
VQDVDWSMERSNLSNFANQGIHVSCKRWDDIVDVSLFVSSLSLWSSYCHSTCFLSLVMDTSQLQGRLDNASILAPFLGRVGLMIITVIRQWQWYWNGALRDYDNQKATKDYRVTIHNLSEFYRSIQEY